MKKKFYVTAIEGQRVYFVCGPFKTKKAASANVDYVSSFAATKDPRADFMAWGISATAEAHECPLVPLKTGIGYNLKLIKTAFAKKG